MTARGGKTKTSERPPKNWGNILLLRDRRIESALGLRTDFSVMPLDAGATLKRREAV